MQDEKNLEINKKLEDEENKSKKILIDKLNEKIAKDKQRSLIRKENLTSYKKIEMSNFNSF